MLITFLLYAAGVVCRCLLLFDVVCCLLVYVGSSVAVACKCSLCAVFCLLAAVRCALLGVVRNRLAFAAVCCYLFLFVGERWLLVVVCWLVLFVRCVLFSVGRCLFC